MCFDEGTGGMEHIASKTPPLPKKYCPLVQLDNGLLW
jgi:hypothetical protein